VRAAGALNVFVRFTADPTEPQYWGSMYDRMSAHMRETFIAAFKAGSEQHALWPRLDVRAEDRIVDKTRYSAFIPGTCDLHELLQARGLDTLIVTGTVTNCCCESTARDAMQMGYKVRLFRTATRRLTMPPTTPPWPIWWDCSSRTSARPMMRSRG
jgi:ureidoacrylate peracid hydrolase